MFKYEKRPEVYRILCYNAPTLRLSLWCISSRQVRLRHLVEVGSLCIGQALTASCRGS